MIRGGFNGYLQGAVLCTFPNTISVYLHACLSHLWSKPYCTVIVVLQTRTPGKLNVIP